MKLTSYLKVAFLAVPLLFTSCHKQLVEKGAPQVSDAEQQQDFLQKVTKNTQKAKFLTSKVKFSVEVGQQHIALTGNLKMKRDDVIQMQLMAFGFVEAGRLEFTKDYVLIMDRINKQYIKAPYSYVEFLRNSGINFYTLQALFWDELFQPGQQALTKESLGKYSANLGGDDVVITYEQGRLGYSWLASDASGIIKMANILYKDPVKGNSQLNWDYQEFIPFNEKRFPTDMTVTLTTPAKEVKLGIVLKYLGNNSEWETRTKVSDKYREVDIDEMLRRFLSL